MIYDRHKAIIPHREVTPASSWKAAANGERRPGARRQARDSTPSCRIAGIFFALAAGFSGTRGRKFSDASPLGDAEKGSLVAAGIWTGMPIKLAGILSKNVPIQDAVWVARQIRFSSGCDTGSFVPGRC